MALILYSFLQFEQFPCGIDWPRGTFALYSIVAFVSQTRVQTSTAKWAVLGRAVRSRECGVAIAMALSTPNRLA